MVRRFSAGGQGGRIRCCHRQSPLANGRLLRRRLDGLLPSSHTTATGKADLYYLFLEKACRLVNDADRIGMIVPNKMFYTRAATALRELLTDERWIDSIVDFGTERIFAGATNYSCILLLRRRARGPVTVTRATNHFDSQTTFKVARAALNGQPWNLIDDERDRVWKAVASRGEPLRHVVQRFGTGVQTGADRIFIVAVEEAAKKKFEPGYLRPILKGRDVRRYNVRESDKLLIFPYAERDGAFELLTERELEAKAPRILAYLEEHKSELAERVWFGK